MKNNKNKDATVTLTKSTSKTELNSEEIENNFYENIVDTVREPLLILDKDLRVVKASKSFFDYFKVNSDETIGKLIYDLGDHQWDIPKLRELLETILPEKAVFDNFEVEHDFLSIGKRFMLLNARQIERASGKEKVILLAIEDITQRKREEKSLREKNQLTSEYLNILLDHAHTPIIIWDSSLLINRFNHEFEKLSGYESSEIIDKPIKMLFPEDKADSNIDLLNNNLNDDNSEAIEIDILTKDKTIKTVLWNSKSIFDEEDKKIVATIAQDITNRKQTENKLGILETRYRRLFESAKDGILILDAETGKIIDVNPFLCNLLEYSKENFIDKELWQIGLFKDIAANKEKFLNLQRNEYVRYDDLPLQATNGKKIYVEFVSNVYLVNNHKVIQCNIRDITEHKQIQQKIKDSEKRFRAIFDQSPFAIALVDTKGHTLISNLKLSKMVGYSLDELSKMKFTDFTYPEDIDKDMKKFTDLTSGKINSYALEKRFVHKNGSIVWVNLIVSLLSGDSSSPIEIIGMAEDITVRKISENELKENETLLKEAMKIARLGAWEYDVESDQFTFNDQFYMLLRTTAEKEGGYIMSSSNYARKFVHPDDISVVGLETKKALLSSDPNYYSRIDHRIIYADGNVGYISVHIRIKQDKHGRTVKTYGVNQDITEGKQAEKELIKAKEKAEESDKMKSEFLSQMSHEIRTPINAVLGYVGYLEDLIVEPKDPEAIECFNGINLASNRIIRTIDLLLNAAELQTGRYQPHFHKIDLDKEILKKLYKEQLLNANQRGLELIYNCKLNDSEILADEYSATQIFANLIDNAIKYTKKGKVEILLKENIKGNIIVEIKDTGIGIAREFLPKLFNLFAQEEQGYSRSFDGNGLGLALVQKYCEINHTKIEVDSEKNVGTTFRVTFNNKFNVN